MLEARYGYYVRRMLWLLYWQRVMVIMLEACYGYFVRNVLWLLC